MKRLFILLLLPVLAMQISSCKKVKDKINEVSTTTITTDFIIPIKVIDQQKDRIDIPFSGSADYAIPGNKDLKEHLKQITKIEVLSLEMRVSEANPDDLVLKQGDFNITKKNDNTEIFSFSTPANFPLVTNSSYQIGNDNADYEALNNIINDLGDIELNGNGIVTYNPRSVKLSFEFIIKVQATVSANL